MKHTRNYLALGFGLLLLGAGCSAPADTPEPTVPPMDGDMVEEVTTEPRMIDFHNNYNPSYDFIYDDNAFTIAIGPAAELREAENDFLTVNSQVVLLVPEGVPSQGLQTASSLVMKFIPGESPSNLDVEGALPGEVSVFEDAEIAGFDARLYTMADGTTHTAWLTPNGYYLLSVFDPAAQSVADSIVF